MEDIKLNLNELKQLHIIYEISDEYYKLDNKGKYLMNNIIKYCEHEKKYPQEKDISIKNGYISRSQFYNYFQQEGVVLWHKYINPIVYLDPQKPKRKTCNQYAIIKYIKEKECKCCHEILPIDNFRNGKNYCVKCTRNKKREINTVHRYAQYGLNIKKVTDLNPIQWYNCYMQNNMLKMPSHIYQDKNNIKMIIRYVVFDIEKLTLDDILNGKASIKLFKKYRLAQIINSMFNGLPMCLNFCIDELKDMFKKGVVNHKYATEKGKMSIIENFIQQKNITLNDILTTAVIDRKKDNAMYSFITHNFCSIIDMWLWYFNKKQIRNKNKNRQYRPYDFNKLTSNYWANREHRVERIKEYCEYECVPNILSIINNTLLLQQWAYKYFKQSDIAKIVPSYSQYYSSLYDVLIDVYPQIIENHTLFKWEWHQWNTYDRDFLIQSLKDFVTFRIGNLINNPIEDIPKYLTRNAMNQIYPKFNKHIDRKRFSNYYEWACLSFPEYKDKWTIDNFEKITSTDGNVFDSYQERDVYEYIQNYTLFKYIKSVGKMRTGKYTFKIKNSKYTRFCPDFVIEDIFYKNEKSKLQKPIVIEYYGLYQENREDNEIIKNYEIKTKAKEKFYKSREDIYYIGIFPDDVKNNFKGLAEKLALFLYEILAKYQ